MSSTKHHVYELRLPRPLRKVELVSFGPPPVPHAEHQRLVADAYERGKRTAEQTYQAQMSSQRHEIVEYQHQVLERLEQEVSALLQGCSDRLPSLIFALVEKVLEGIQLDGAQLEQAIQHVLAEVQTSEAERVEIRLCPGDYEKLQTHLADGTELNLATLDIRVDERLRPGDLTAHSRFGLLDARLDTRLTRLWREVQAG